VWGLWTVVDGLGEQLAEIRAQAEQEIEIVVAARELPAGHTLVPDDLARAPLRAEFVPLEAVTRPELLVGRVVSERILPGDLLRDERLARPEAGIGLNAIIPEGMRALSFNLAGADQVSGFVLPGNRIDVIAGLVDGEGHLIETTTLLQGVPVLAVNDRTHEGRRTPEGPRRKPQVTVAIAPDQAERITHVFHTGVVRLTLRGDTDLQNFAHRGTLTRDLLGSEEMRAVSIDEWYELAHVDRPLYIIRGSEVTTEGG